MAFKVIGRALGLLVCLVSFELLAAEPRCVTLALLGMDTSFEKELVDQLKNELGTPIATGKATASCCRLQIELRDKKAKILLEGERVFKTELSLDEILPAHWTRAIALSSAGLLALQNPPPVQQATSSDETRASDSPSYGSGQGEPDREATKPESVNPAEGPNNGRDKKAKKKAEAVEKTPEPEKPRSTDKESPSRVRLYLHGGGHVIPKFAAWVGEVMPGVGFIVGAFNLDMSLAGIWGRKTVVLGKIYTAGVGLRLTLWWRALRRRSFVLKLGPAVEALGVWAYGRPIETVASHTKFAPVVNTLLLIGGSFVLSSRGELFLAAGGGGSVLHFVAQADGNNASGLAGGLVTLIAGIDFNI